MLGSLGARPETLRIWERRYGLGASHKAANGRRLYTQTDLEHLQIVVSLVSQGFRIGEIASMERKTLEALQEQGGGTPVAREVKPKVLFVGSNLCEWLDQHSGCLSYLDSRLLRAGVDVAEVPDRGEINVDMVIAEEGALNELHVKKLLAMREELEPRAMLVFFQFSSKHLLAELDSAGIRTTQAPLTTESFATQIRGLLSAMEVDRGVNDAGDLAVPRSRLFSDSEIQSVRGEESNLACGCSQHIAQVIQSLTNFEQYSSNCAVENWSDAATHTCVYAYTNQARWLMEKALQAVLEEHANERK